MTAPVVAAGAAALAVLDQAFRASQARIALATAKVIFARWPAVQADDLAGTSPTWLRDSIAVVLAGRARAEETADAYVAQVRRLHAPGAAPYALPPTKPPSIEQIRKSLEFQAISTTAREFYRIDNVRTGVRDDPNADQDSEDRTADGSKQRIMQEAIARATATAVRHVTTAGQDRVYDHIAADPVATGWARTTKPGCCYFCAMLASRGAVYKEDSFEESDPRFSGPGNAKVHDTCGCGLRPIYSRSDPLPERNADLEQLWIDMKDLKMPGEGDVQAWRRIYGESELAQPFAE